MPASEAVLTEALSVGAILKKAPNFLGTSDLYLLYPYSMYETVTGQAPAADAFWFRSSDHAASYESMGQILMELGNSRSELQDLAANGESQRAMVTVVNVFSYGFIILISLISMTNVFNTISTSIALRRREFAMLRSVGLTQRGFARMMDYEQQALGILIQPAHRKQALAPELRRQQIQHGLPAAVLRGRQHPGGLVEHQPGKTAVAQPLPVHKDLRGLRVHLVLRRPGGHAVHQDPALPDQLPDLPPGVPTPCGDDLIQPRFFHIVPSACDFFCSILS